MVAEGKVAVAAADLVAVEKAMVVGEKGWEAAAVEKGWVEAAREEMEVEAGSGLVASTEKVEVMVAEATATVVAAVAEAKVVAVAVATAKAVVAMVSVREATGEAVKAAEARLAEESLVELAAAQRAVRDTRA